MRKLKDLRDETEINLIVRDVRRKYSFGFPDVSCYDLANYIKLEYDLDVSYFTIYKWVHNLSHIEREYSVPISREVAIKKMSQMYEGGIAPEEIISMMTKCYTIYAGPRLGGICGAKVEDVAPLFKKFKKFIVNE